MIDDEVHYKFADLTWQSRWNSMQAPYVGLWECGHDLVATGPMGIVRFNLDNTEDLEAFDTKMEAFLMAIRAAKIRYDAVMEYVRAPESRIPGVYRSEDVLELPAIEGDENGN